MTSTSQDLAICSLVSGALMQATGACPGGDQFVLAWACGLRLRPCSGAGSRLIDEEIWYDATCSDERQQEIIALRIAEWASDWFGARGYGRELYSVAIELLGRDADMLWASESRDAPLFPAHAAWCLAINARSAADARALGIRRLSSSSTLRARS